MVCSKFCSLGFQRIYTYVVLVYTAHRVIMYYIETKAICSHQQFGQFLGLHETGGVGVGIFVDSIL